MKWTPWRRPENPEPSTLDRASVHAGIPDIEDAINQMLGRDPDQHRPPRLSWGGLLEALADAGIKVNEEELIALPLTVDLSDRAKAEISGD